MKKVILLTFVYIFNNLAYSQADILIYHPRAQESIKVFDRKSNSLLNEPLRYEEGKKIKIQIINPNPLFYKYELKYEEQEVKSEDKALTDALGVIGNLLSTVYIQRTRSLINLPQEQSDFQAYILILNNLLDEIETAQRIINQSDNPEVQADALRANRNSGLRYASDQITGNLSAGSSPLTLPTSSNHFLSSRLATDLDNLLNGLNNMDDGQKRIFKLVNNTLVIKVKEMQKNLKDVKTEINNEFIVTAKEAKIYLIVKPIDATNTGLVRVVHSGDEKIEIAHIIPNFKRATLELVPVGNFVFSKDVKEFFIENDLVQNRLKNTTAFKAGLVLNVNVSSFGKSKEMAVGLGLGYRFNETENAFENLYISSLFSYKNFFRIGLGLGWAQFPYELKDGGKVGQPLPTSITNLDDLITYKEQPSAFLTIAFTGLNLTKKK